MGAIDQMKEFQVNKDVEVYKVRQEHNYCKFFWNLGQNLSSRSMLYFNIHK